MTLYVLDLIGVVVFAVTGALASARRGLDVFGLVVVAVVTAIGGGTLRDLLLGATPVFWVRQPSYLIAAAVAGLGVCALGPWLARVDRLLVVLDACGLALFTAIGTRTALAAGVSPIVAPVMGMITGVAGGLMRDLLCGRTPLVLRREVYATASLAGAVVCVAASRSFHGPSAMALAALVVLVTRLLAIFTGLSLPRPWIVPAPR